MKMEHTVKASFDGTITEVRFKEGQFVGPGQIIIVLEWNYIFLFCLILKYNN